MNDVMLGLLLIDGVIAFSLVEALILFVHHRVTGRGVAPREFAWNMASGLCLMGALRSFASGAGLMWVAVFLLAAGLCHAADIVRRWQGRRSPHALVFGGGKPT